jgi:hypothetical protein
MVFHRRSITNVTEEFSQKQCISTDFTSPVFGFFQQAIRRAV